MGAQGWGGSRQSKLRQSRSDSYIVPATKSGPWLSQRGGSETLGEKSIHRGNGTGGASGILCEEKNLTNHFLFLPPSGYPEKRLLGKKKRWGKRISQKTLEKVERRGEGKDVVQGGEKNRWSTRRRYYSEVTRAALKEERGKNFHSEVKKGRGQHEGVTILTGKGLIGGEHFREGRNERWLAWGWKRRKTTRKRI